MDGVPDDDNDNGDEAPVDAVSQVHVEQGMSVAGLVSANNNTCRKSLVGNIGKNNKTMRRRKETATGTDPRRSKRVPVPKKTD